MPDRVARILPERTSFTGVRRLCHIVARIQLNNTDPIIVLEIST
jgi:hypothetical protein